MYCSCLGVAYHMTPRPPPPPPPPPPPRPTPPPKDVESSSGSYGKTVEVRHQSVARPKKDKKKKRGKKDDSDFVFMDRQSIIENQFEGQQFLPQATQERERKGMAGAGTGGFQVVELSSSPKKHHGVPHPLSQVCTHNNTMVMCIHTHIHTHACTMHVLNIMQFQPYLLFSH